MQTKKGLRYCRALKKHTADDCNATSMALRKTSPFLGVGWSGQKVDKDNPAHQDRMVAAIYVCVYVCVVCCGA